jgi:transcriptional regulator with XRE-family HTH domain
MYEKLAVTIGYAARCARQARGLTREQMAEALQLPPAAYGRLERGRLLPTVPMLVDLAEVLGTTLDALVGRAAQEEAVLAQPTGEVSSLLRELLLLTRGLDEEQLQRLVIPDGSDPLPN